MNEFELTVCINIAIEQHLISLHLFILNLNFYVPKNFETLC